MQAAEQGDLFATVDNPATGQVIRYAPRNYPNTAGAKERGGTSQEAAASIEDSGRAGTIRRLVLEALESNRAGLTTDECAALLGMSVLSVRPRFSELAKQGKIRKTDERRENASGKRAVVWSAIIIDKPLALGVECAHTKGKHE